MKLDLDTPVQVWWRDSCSVGGGRWGSREELLADCRKPDLLEYRSVGYVLADDKDRLVLVQNRACDYENVADVMVIPREAVTKVELLKPAPAKNRK